MPRKMIHFRGIEAWEMMAKQMDESELASLPHE